MKLQFKILWIDDDWQDDESNIALTQKKEEIMKILYNLHFEVDDADIIIEKGDRDIKDMPYNSEDFDLFLVDFHMWTKNGFQYIEEIRNKSQYTEIIFYSQSWIQEELKAYLKKKDFLEGIFISDRVYLERKFQQVLNIIDKKVNNLYSMRGLVLAETAEIDYVLCEIIDKLCTKGKINTNWFQLWKRDSNTNTFTFRSWPKFNSQWSISFPDWLSEKTSNSEKIEWLTNSKNPNKMPQSVLNLQQDLLSYRDFYKDKRNPLAHSRTLSSNNQLSAGNVTYSIQDLKDMRWKLLSWKKTFTNIYQQLDNLQVILKK